MSDTILSTLTDQNVDDMIETGASAIGYWAGEATAAERSKATDLQVCIFAEVDDYDRTVHYLTRDDIRQAYAALLSLDQQHVGRMVHGYFIDSWRDRDDNGIDTGFIDGDAGDCLLQLAALGEITYG